MYLRIIINIYNKENLNYFFFFINRKFFFFSLFKGLFFDFFFLKKFSFSRFSDSILIFTIFMYNFNYVNIKIKKKNKKISILYENDNLIIINKTPNVSMNLLLYNIWNYFFFCFSFLDFRFINFINRLDKETSGIVLFSKNFFSFRKYCEIFKKRLVKKNYFGFCYSKNKSSNVVIKNFHIRKFARSIFLTTKKFFLKSKYCFSVFKFFNFYNNFSEIYIKIITGRSHQIRSQLKSINSFLLNDKKYGFSLENFCFDTKIKLKLFLLNNLFLHSYFIFFFDPFLGIYLKLVSPLSFEFLNFKKTWDIRIRT